MPRNPAIITEREKAALYYYVFGGCVNWAVIHAIAKKGEFAPGKNPKSANKMAYDWKNRPQIAAFLKDLQNLKAIQDNENATRKANEILKEREREENKEHTESAKGKQPRQIVDFSNPQERRKQYNTIINNAGDDPKTQLDALKVLEQLQKDDKQAAKDNQIQRFYTPLKCRECPLYEKAKKKVTI